MTSRKLSEAIHKHAETSALLAAFAAELLIITDPKRVQHQADYIATHAEALEQLAFDVKVEALVLMEWAAGEAERRRLERLNVVPLRRDAA